MSKSRFKNSKARRTAGGFVPFPLIALRSTEFASLSAHAIKLLTDLLAQYRGNNNGDLSCAWTLMKERGWKSRDTLNKARRELLDKGFIMLTRQGGIHKCSLYACTWFAIDDVFDRQGNSKLDGGVRPTSAPPGGWMSLSPVLPVQQP